MPICAAAQPVRPPDSPQPAVSTAAFALKSAPANYFTIAAARRAFARIEHNYRRKVNNISAV
jgi:hypothetical protein